MRRSDREVTDAGEIDGIIRRCSVCRVAMTDGEGRPYMVPLNFGYEWADGTLILYFHSAPEGQKIELLRQNPHVCVEMDGAHALKEGGHVACEYSFYYESVIGFGQASFLDSPAQKEHALRLLMCHMTGRDDFSFSASELRGVAVFQIRVDEWTGKRRQG